MRRYNVYTDGSFNDYSSTHGGIVFVDDNGKVCSKIHVYTEVQDFCASRNVGGEIIAAWSAIMSIINSIKQDDNYDKTEPIEINLYYDYEGIGKWLNGSWKTNKAITKWYKKSVLNLINQFDLCALNLHWVRGHNGHYGNEVADAVASYDMIFCKQNNIDIVELNKEILGYV